MPAKSQGSSDRLISSSGTVSLRIVQRNLAGADAVAEAFLARHLGGRTEPIGEDFAGSSHEIREGEDIIEALSS